MSDQDGAELGEARPAPEAGDVGTGGAREPEQAREGAAWGAPLLRLEQRWTWLETRLITLVLFALLLSLVSWVVLQGLASPLGAGNAAGVVMRAVLGATGLALLAWKVGARWSAGIRRGVTILALLAGCAFAPAWRTVGIAYFDNVMAWAQEGSTLTLMGGLRGVATRLTLWLALLGASLATGAGKHIHIDVLLRFLPKRLRLPAAVVNFSATALMCFAGAWGFVDYIAIDSFGANADDRAGTKIAKIADKMGEHAFLARKQLGLDLRTIPRVVAGTRYDRWMTAGAWNEWVKGAGFEAHYPAESVRALLVPEDASPHPPLCIAPNGESTRGILVHDLNFVFPFGLVAIGLRFLLRMLLALSGRVDLDPDQAHKEELGLAADLGSR